MKNLTQVAAEFIGNSEGRIVHFQAVLGGWRKLDEPMMSTELKCAICDGSDHGVTIATPIGESYERVWICHKRDCGTLEGLDHRRAIYPQATPKRVLEWPLFCEINGLADGLHDIRYEDIKQSHEIKSAIVHYFKDKNKHFMMMMGPKGTGKTYAALGICEMHTRVSTSCIFTTQTAMTRDWQESVFSKTNYVSKLKNIQLLVIDDFGIGDPAVGFMSFFMDLMDSRMHWKDKKTIITTNLNSQGLVDICGDSLVDRLRTSVKLKFQGNSRRF